MVTPSKPPSPYEQRLPLLTPCFKMFLERSLNDPHHPTSSTFHCYPPSPSTTPSPPPLKLLIIHEEVHDIISSVDTTKGAGYDTIPTKLIQMSAGVITKPITNIINLTIQTGTYPELLKTAKVSPVFKKEDPLSKEN